MPRRGPKILVIEDDEILVRSILKSSRDYANVFIADTPEQGWTIYQEHQHTLKLIYLGGHLRRGTTSLKLLTRIRDTGFKGQIISITSDESLRQSMFPTAPDSADPSQPRCDEHVPKEKIISHIMQFLNTESLRQ